MKPAAIALLGSVLACVLACKTTTTTPPTLQPLGDAAAASVGSACSRLVGVSCYPPDGGLQACVTGLSNMLEDPLAPPPDLACASSAGNTSPQTSEKCQGISCPTLLSHP